MPLQHLNLSRFRKKWKISIVRVVGLLTAYTQLIQQELEMNRAKNLGWAKAERFRGSRDFPLLAVSREVFCFGKVLMATSCWKASANSRMLKHVTRAGKLKTGSSNSIWATFSFQAGIAIKMFWRRRRRRSAPLWFATSGRFPKQNEWSCCSRRAIPQSSSSWERKRSAPERRAHQRFRTS